MTPLTASEVITRCDLGRAIDKNLLRWSVTEITKAGLVVVDTTDTPNEPSVYEEASDRVPEALRAKVASALLDLDAKLSAGGSPGERGTVTQETSADEIFEPPHEPFEDITSWLDRQASKAAAIGAPEVARMYQRAVNDIMDARSAAAELKPAPPFPNAYPGPQVDGQPTWGAYLRDVPDDDGWEWSVGNFNGTWVPGSESRRALRDVSWVLVRRIPQPAERWTVERHEHSAHQLRDGGVVCGVIYHPFDPDDIARKLNAAEVLVENEETGT